MATTAVSAPVIQQFEVMKDELIAAPISIVFETLLEQMGPHNETPDGTPLMMKLEAWPGGRWFRDLGHNTGHLWGHVQAIKAPELLEIQGPMFMSSPVAGHLQYRLTSEDGKTRLRFSHRVVGLIPQDISDGARVGVGWNKFMSKVIEASERKAKEAK
jgi:hypothetical protein